MDGLREGARDDHLPRGLLARAALRRVRAARTDATAATADLDAAAKDLQEAEQIAERGSMRLHLADANLEWARWHLEKGERDDARGRLATARELVTACGYGRREGEVAELEAVLGEG